MRSNRAALPFPVLALSLLVGCAPASEVPETSAAEAGADPGVEERVARVERSLLPTVRVRGRDHTPASLASRMEALDVPAVSVAVVHDGRIDWARAWGEADREAGRRATTETLFQAASISKPVAATAVMSLVAEGVLDLDQPVNERLTSWRVPEHAWEETSPVTLRRLMTHSAGTSVHGFPGYARGEPLPSTTQILDGRAPANTGAVRVTDEPGSLVRYSGGGTTITQQLLQDVTGLSFPRLVRERVLEPAGMEHSTYEQPLPEARSAEAATGHRADGTPVEGRYHTYPEMAAAGLWTTPTDLARWILALQAARRGEGDLLPPAAAAEMLTRQIGDWGLGPALAGEGDALRFEHGGSNQGFKATFHAFAHRGEGVVVMTNGDNGSVVAAEVVQAVADAYGWEGFEPRWIERVELPDEALSRFEGSYRLAGDEPFVVEVSARDGSLWVERPDAPVSELVPTDDTTFAFVRDGRVMRFLTDGAGTVVALQVGDTRLEREG